MKMLSKYKNIFFLCTAIIILSLMLFIVESREVQLKISSNEILTANKKYSIYPDLSHYHINNVDTNATIRVKLSDPQYSLVDFIEDLRVKLQPEQGLLMLIKRIAELNTWGEEIPIINKTNNANDLRSWWIPYQTNPLSIINSQWFNSWESILARYLLSTEKYIVYIKSQEFGTKNAQAILLRQYLIKDQQQINQYIYNSERNHNDKEYLQNLSDSVFQDLNSQVNQLVPEYNPITHHYDLSLIKKDKEYGIYNISISKPQDIKFDWGNALLQQKISKFTPGTDSESYIFNNIEITPNLNKLTFSLTEIKNFAQGNWTSEIDQSNKKYEYILNLIDINPKIEYMLSLTYKTIYPLDISIKEFQKSLTDSDEITSDKSNEIWKDSILSPKNSSNYVSKISFTFTDGDKLNKQIIILESEKPLPEDFFEHIKLEILPIYEPEITLQKIAKLNNQTAKINIKKIKEDVYLVNLKNMNSFEEKKVKMTLGFTYWITKETNHQNTTVLTVIFWPPILIKIILFILVSIIVVKLIYEIYLKQLLENNKEVYLPFINSLKNSVIFLSKITSAFGKSVYLKLRKVRLILFTIVIAGITMDIFLNRFGLPGSNSLITIYIVTSFWLITLAVYYGKITLSFYMSLILFVLFSIVLVINLPIISDRILTWSYVFLLIGSIHALDEACIKRDFTYETTNQNLSIVPKLLSLSSRIRKYFKYCAHILDKLLRVALTPQFYIFYQHTKVNLHKSISYSAKNTWLFTAVIIVFFAMLFIYIGFRSHNLYVVNNPTIQKIEPKIVYRTSKIILRGRSFGADPDGSIVRVMSSYGLVHKDFWTDTKIYFTIPMNWKDGEIKIWIEKPVLWDGRWSIRKSNVVTIQLIPTSPTFTPLDDLFFEELKTLDKETLKLNRYE